ncbi:DegV family EDD domain-containing protein [Oceanivirga salmonicida]|uniref:DegV family EDD domain-containing protein n=1 Tax=Oceanivirga salmonicida TaxID=1769291 RepID=UPI000832C3CF|nr:DegV family EDD domain-containing protein [Oceanivirga salmonicida]
MGIKYIDAKRLRRVLMGGAKWVQQYEEYLNELNVYPVPDGDTGTNMCMTLQSMLKEIEENSDDKTSMEDLTELIEDAVLIGARGNSGTILSQIINGFLKGMENKKKLLPSDIALALKSAKELAYNVVTDPVEGTILTVIRKVSEKAEEIKDYEYFNEFINELVKAADEAVESTPDLLPKLKEAGVVDSGGKGLFYFLEGIGKVLTEIELFANASVVESEFDRTILDIDHNLGEIKHKYCTEFIITNMNFDVEELKKELLEMGDSAVFAKSTKKFKTHIHTNNPGLVIEIAAKRGDLKNIKIENMKLQNEGVLENEKDLAKVFINKKIDPIKKEAYIVLSDTISLKDEFLDMGADVVILGGQSQNPSVSDILNAINKVLDTNKHIYILANNKNVISTANLAVEKVDRTVIVVPTKTMLEGLFYMKYPYTSHKEKNIMNKYNYSIEITKAVRDTNVDGISISSGDYLLLVNSKIVYSAKIIDDLLVYIEKNYINDNTLALTVVEGLNRHENIIKKIKSLKYNFTQETKYISTNNENYDFYILIENKKPNLPKIAIITDSASDLTNNIAENLNISVIPIRLTCENKEYKDGINIRKEEFWNMLINEGKKFKTAQPSPKEMVNLYLELFKKGYEKILAIPISSKLSGSYQVLKLAREISKRESDITIFDSKAVSMLQAYLTTEAAKKAIKGESIERIVNHLIKLREKSTMYISIDNLKYLQEGGRISKTAQTVGDFLNLKPIITMVDGTLSVEKKVLGGDNSVIKYIDKAIYNKYPNQSMYVVSAYGGTEKQLEFTNRLLKTISSNNRKATIIRPSIEIGATVGTHAGPVSAILFVPKLL